MFVFFKGTIEIHINSYAVFLPISQPKQQSWRPVKSEDECHNTELLISKIHEKRRWYQWEEKSLPG